MISPEQLKAIAPTCPNPDAWAETLTTSMLRFGIAGNDEDMAEFLAQCSHESQEFNRLQENLNYKPDQLMKVWPSRFPTLEVANQYAAAPHALANYVYANRYGNGDAASGDGWKFRGMGIIGVTFKNNYAQLGKELKLDLLGAPEILQTKQPACDAAAFFWKRHGLNPLADDGEFLSVTRAINGGLIGLADREKYLARSRKEFSV